jgi:hypothetical protein
VRPVLSVSRTIVCGSTYVILSSAAWTGRCTRERGRSPQKNEQPRRVPIGCLSSEPVGTAYSVFRSSPIARLLSLPGPDLSRSQGDTSRLSGIRFQHDWALSVRSDASRNSIIAPTLTSIFSRFPRAALAASVNALAARSPRAHCIRDQSTLMEWRADGATLGRFSSSMPSANLAVTFSASTLAGSRMERVNSPREISRRW